MDIQLNGRKVVDLEVDGVDSTDGPEFTGAFFCSAAYDDTGEQLTDEEVDMLTLKYPEVVNEMAFDFMVGVADFYDYND